ncbi:hypothetical protein [Paenibacillus sp. EPM92]|uniref:hypothetical protein n=1 Tax=Paenibacillus sp. EPM92 TaxID=1561195 RepID=UPI00191585BC|nr:hypothetical protein [Paenibacillus sp. EPM92]
MTNQASAFKIAKQAGAAYDYASVKGGMSVLGRKPITGKERDHRNKRNQLAKQARRRNRG